MKLSYVGIFAVAATGHFSAFAAIIERQSAVCTCAGRRYTSTDIENALNKVDSGSSAGKYPENFRDDEGFDLSACSSPFREFPLKIGGAYNGGSPGADRLIIDANGDACACVTHTGAANEDGFVECQF